MAYNTSTGSRDFDDMRYQQDRDTQIDWDQDSISFKTNDITRVVIDNSAISASGDATFVGATVVGSTLNVSGNVFVANLKTIGRDDGVTRNANIQFADVGPLGNSYIALRDGGDDLMTVDGGGNVGIGTSSPTDTLTVVGDVSGSGTFQIVGNTFLGLNLNVSGTTTLAGLNFSLGSDAEGDMYYRNSAGALTRLAKGDDDQVMTMDGNVPNWEAASGGISFNGSTANGLVTYGNASTADVESDILFNAGILTMDASISGSGTLQMVGNTFLGGTLNVTGATTLAGDTTFTNISGSGSTIQRRRIIE